MKITRPATEIELCDVCRREDGVLATCPACGSRYCWTCRAIIAGCIHTVDVCEKCGHREDVLNVVMYHAPVIKAAIKARTVAIAQLRSNSPGENEAKE